MTKPEIGSVVGQTPYMRFVVSGYSKSGKTAVVEVVNVTSGVRLGFINWYGPWRQYCFNPNSATIFNMQCLREIADICDNLTRNQRKGWR